MAVTGYALVSEKDLPGAEPLVVQEFVQLSDAQTARTALGCARAIGAYDLGNDSSTFQPGSDSGPPRPKATRRARQPDRRAPKAQR